MASYGSSYMMGNGMNGGFSGGMYPMYQSGYYPQAAPQQSYSPAQQPMQSNVIPVDGEVGAKAFMFPAGSSGPIALWDTNDNVIYMRTFNAAGMPNPLKKLRYTEEEMPVAMLPSGNSANGGNGGGNSGHGDYVTRQDFDDLRTELRNLMQQNMTAQQNQNPNQNGNSGRNNNSSDGNRRLG